VNKGESKPADLLHEAGLRRTPMRTNVLTILSQNGQPLTALQIAERLTEVSDRVTLYRTLNTLTKKKLLHRVRGDDLSWRYGIADTTGAGRHEHAHFVCDECGTVECLSDTPAPNYMAKQSKVRRGYHVEYSELLVHGTCADCGK
jgi:Fur family transcriptional regulator, ferric uptake regulator